MGTLFNEMDLICRASLGTFTGPRFLGDRLSMCFQNPQQVVNPQSGAFLILETLRRVACLQLVVERILTPSSHAVENRKVPGVRAQVIAMLVMKFKRTEEWLRTKLVPFLGPAVM